MSRRHLIMLLALASIWGSVRAMSLAGLMLVLAGVALGIGSMGKATVTR